MAYEQIRFTPICQLTAEMKNVNAVFIVIDIGRSRRTMQGREVRSVRVADQTGSIMMSLWNELGNLVAPGDICRLTNGYTVVYKGSLSLSCGKLGELVKTGEFFMTFSEKPNMSEFSAELAAKYPMRKDNHLPYGSPDEENGDVSRFTSGGNDGLKSKQKAKEQGGGVKVQRTSSASRRGTKRLKLSGTSISSSRRKPEGIRKISCRGI